LAGGCSAGRKYINADYNLNITHPQLASQYWTPDTKADHLPYSAKIIERIYNEEIGGGGGHSARRINMLEFSQYLEQYLWPHYQRETATHAHLMSIVIMANEKFKERVEVWTVFEKLPDQYPAFFRHVLESCLPGKKAKEASSSLRERTALLMFINHCFNSMEIELCREQAKRLVSLSMWHCLQPRKFPSTLLRSIKTNRNIFLCRPP